MLVMIAYRDGRAIEVELGHVPYFTFCKSRYKC
jgi:hypothetical protein